MENLRRYLFVTIEGGGNIPPVLGLARRLAAKGHRVNVLTEPCLEQVVKSAGLEFLPFREYFTRTDRAEDVFHDWKPASPLKNPAMEHVIFGPSEITASEVQHAIDMVSPDVVVADCLLPAAVIPAEAAGIKNVVLFHMPEYFPGPNRPPGMMGLLPGKSIAGKWRDKLLGRLFHKVTNQYLPVLNKTRAAYGLDKLENAAEIIGKADLRLIQTLRSFDFPIEPAPSNVRYTGPVLDDPDWAGDWQSDWQSEDKRPLVVVAFSSTFQNQQSIIQNAIHALEGLNVRGLVTTGPALAGQKFDVPQNVRVVTSAPHSAVFPKADLVITHGGHGTLMRALANGLPLICIPMGRDQNDNAAKIAFHGCGIRLNVKSSPRKIMLAVDRILNDPSFRKNAANFQQVIKSEAAKDTAIAELESIS